MPQTPQAPRTPRIPRANMAWRPLPRTGTPVQALRALGLGIGALLRPVHDTPAPWVGRDVVRVTALGETAILVRRRRRAERAYYDLRSGWEAWVRVPVASASPVEPLPEPEP